MWIPLLSLSNVNAGGMLEEGSEGRAEEKEENGDRRRRRRPERKWVPDEVYQQNL